MKPIFRFFTQITFVLLLGIGVSVLLIAIMPCSVRQMSIIDLPETGVSVFLNAQEGALQVVSAPHNPTSTAQEAITQTAPSATAAPLETAEAKQVNLESNLTKNGVLLNVSPQQGKTKAALTFVKVNDLGKYIKNSRIKQGMKIADLKAATGLTEQQILNIEDGKTVPTPDIALGFETILQINVVYK